MIDLETTSSSQYWSKYFMVHIKTSAVTFGTNNFFTHKALAKPQVMISYYNGKHKSKKEGENIYATIMKSIHSTIKT